MVRTILGGMGILVGLALAVASVGLLIWLLWWLWTRRDEEAELVEIELELAEPEPAAGLAITETEERAVTLDPPEDEMVSEEPKELEVEEEVADAVEAEAPEEPESVEEETAAEPEPPEEPATPPTPDKLARIEGIGPKISSVLQEAGITTFAQLADTTPEQIEQILEESSPRLRRLAKPATWPEQAALAASGEWEALTALQKELKGGRRG